MALPASAYEQRHCGATRGACCRSWGAARALAVLGRGDGRALPAGVRGVRALPGGVWTVAGAINLKMLMALLLSGFFVQSGWWIKIVSAIFILPWAMPSIPTILSIRFMLNPEWGVINST